MANNASPDPVPLLMTRPRAAAEAFVGSLPDCVVSRIEVTYSPLLAIAPIASDPAIRDDEGVIFTSSNGVAHSPDGNNRTAFCVGEATTHAAMAKGWAARRRGATADELVADLIQNPPGYDLVHLSGTHTRGAVTIRLTNAGIHTRRVAVYDQVAQSLTAAAKSLLRGTKPVMVPLFSPRSAAQFCEQMPEEPAVHAIVLSNAVAQSLAHASYGSVTIADTPDATAMRNAIHAVLDQLRSG